MLTRTIKVELENYNIDYDLEIKEEELKEGIIDMFCSQFNIPNTYEIEDMIEKYIGYEKLEEDFLESYIENQLFEIEEKFEYELAEKMEKIVKRKKSITLSEIVDEINEPGLIVNWRSYAWYLVKESLDMQGIEYELDDNENERITLKGVE